MVDDSGATQGLVEPPPVNIFLSYVRDDDKNFGFAEPMKNMLEQAINAISIRPAKVFLDREDIPIGANWKEKIEEGVRSSLFFIPVYTVNYSRSQPCREEFLLFQEQSQSIGLSRLVIPIALFGIESVPDKGQDVVADHVRDHQAEDFTQAVLGGPETRDFRESMMRIAHRVVQESRAAEDELAELEAQGAPEATHKEEGGGDLSAESGRGAEGADEGIVELSSRFQELAVSMTNDSSQLGQALTRFGAVARDLPAPKSSADVSKAVVTLASQLEDPSADLDEYGRSILSTVMEADEVLRRLVARASEIEAPEIAEELQGAILEGVASMEGVESVGSQLEGLLASMKTPEAMSASLRKALRPARRGVTNVRDAVGILGDWRSVASSMN